jgi:hypothetical protein
MRAEQLLPGDYILLPPWKLTRAVQIFRLDDQSGMMLSCEQLGVSRS